MMPSPQQGVATAWWERRNEEEALVLHLGDRHDIVPAQIAAMLLAPPTGISGDVAADVLRLEANLRDVEGRISDKVVGTSAGVQACERRLAEVGKTWLAHRRRVSARAELQKAKITDTAARRTLAEARSLRRILREFVIALEPVDGLLAEAAVGWSRSPNIPAGVSVFRDEQYFLRDTRRAALPIGLGRTIGGEYFGELWRRDGDDPVDQPLSRSGCWLVGYIERSQEIYAVRRSDFGSREVWLLGRGFGAQRAHDLLQPLMVRQQEPNSLILVAQAVTSSRKGC